MILSEGIVDIPAKQTILIPSHHDPVELFGTEYVPIIFTNHGATGGTLIKYSDLKKYVKSGEGHKFLDNGYINYQKKMTSNTLLNMKNLRVLSAEKHMKQLLLAI